MKMDTYKSMRAKIHEGEWRGNVEVMYNPIVGFFRLGFILDTKSHFYVHTIY